MAWSILKSILRLHVMQSTWKRQRELWGSSGGRLVLEAAVRNRGKAGSTAVAEGKHKQSRRCGCAHIAHNQQVYRFTPTSPNRGVSGAPTPYKCTLRECIYKALSMSALMERFALRYYLSYVFSSIDCI